MTTIQDNLQTIGAKIKEFSELHQRQANSVKLLAVSKRHPVQLIREAFDAGQTAFGENYVQELLEKKDALTDLDIDWHFIGPLQSNKTRKIAEAANWVHTIDRLKIAQRLSQQRPESMPPLNICIQVNISDEASKSGVNPAELKQLAQEVSELPNLRFRGLMAIPEPHEEFQKQYETFSKIAELQNGLNKQGYDLDTLSMGMSDDMEAAIAAGATIVRIGTAIFGKRPD